MVYNKNILILVLLLLCNLHLLSQQSPGVFTVIPLGIKGGSDESNLSAYLVAPAGDTNYICLDAGTLHAGIKKAIEKGAFKGPVNKVLQNNIKAYFISHPHLDHLAGMIINSPDDTRKRIYGLPFCLNTIKEKYFSWKSWANFADAGEEPRLNKYQYTAMQPGARIQVENTVMDITAFVLSHSAPFQSTGFLVGYKENFLLYLGDTGADTIEKSSQLHQLWQAASPLIRNKKLKAIFIEVSFANDQKKELLFGHLTPDLLMLELKNLSTLAGADAMKNFPVIITHQKPGDGREEKIHRELKAKNSLQVKLVFPEQGIPLSF